VSTAPRIQVLDATGPRLAIVEEGSTAEAVVWPGMGAELRSMHLIKLAPGARTVALEHPSEAAYYVIAGDGRVGDFERGVEFPVELGSMVHTDAGDRYGFRAGSGGLEIVGGPCPPDPALYESIAGGG
jgi:mannose-6-phosphate isomerase-like protein (cupin superfamily)